MEIEVIRKVQRPGPGRGKQGGVDKIKIITLPFKVSKISKEDLESIYAINKIALNSDFMAKLLNYNR